MSDVREWAVAAGDNNEPPPDGAPEGMARAQVNDTIREIMAALARWYQDTRPASLVSGGTGNAYTITTRQGFASLAEMGPVGFRVDRANTGPATLKVNGFPAKPWQKRAGVAYKTGGLVPDQLVSVAYNATHDRFETVGGQTGEFDVGDSMLVMQPTATAGWVQDVDAGLDDVALRLTTGTPGSGGTTPFSTVFGDRTIAQVNLPSFNLSATLAVNASGWSNPGGGHAHPMPYRANKVTAGLSGAARPNLWQGDSNTSTSGVNDHQHFVSVSGWATGAIHSGGSGTAMDFDVNFRDVIKQNKE